MKTILNIIKKEFIQFRRDPKMFAIILIAPVVQLLFLGYAVNMDVELVKLAIWDKDKSEESRELIKKISSTDYFEIVDYVESYNKFQEYIEKGDVLLGLVIPADFEKQILTNKSTMLQAIFDGSDGNKTSISAGYLSKILIDYNTEKILNNSRRLGKINLFNFNIEPKIRTWYNPQLTTRVFMIPGIVALLLSIITLILTSLAIVKEKEIGTLEQILVTPIKPKELIIGKVVPFVLLGFLAVVVVLISMVLIFGIEIKGSITFLLFTSLIYTLSNLGLGIFVSTISKTQQQAMMLAIFAVLLPMVYLSGFAFPIENMPEIIQKIAYAIPLTYFMEIIRGIILKGNGFVELWLQVTIMFVMGIALLVMSTLRFQKRLD